MPVSAFFDKNMGNPPLLTLQRGLPMFCGSHGISSFEAMSIGHNEFVRTRKALPTQLKTKMQPPHHRNAKTASPDELHPIC